MPAYSFLDVNASMVGPGGAINLGNGSGASEEGITLEPLDDADILTIGADGTPMHSLSANKAATVTVRLLKTSPVNQKLMALFNVQRASASLWGQNTISVVTTYGQDVTTCRSVAFKQKPVLTYAKDGGMNEWSFTAGLMDSALGAVN